MCVARHSTKGCVFLCISLSAIHNSFKSVALLRMSKTSVPPSSSFCMKYIRYIHAPQVVHVWVFDNDQFLFPVCELMYREMIYVL